MHKATILKIDQVTHDVKRFRISEPDGFDYEVGDATEIALDREGWREETRPFTMTSLPEEKALEFTIKGYPEHDGVTEQLHKLSEGESILIADPFKTFRYESSSRTQRSGDPGPGSRGLRTKKPIRKLWLPGPGSRFAWPG
jgi:ferredoxin-NADP reductase